MKIGSLVMRDGAALAPMAGVADRVMRRLCSEQGSAWSTTEMVSANALVRAPRSSPALSRLLETSPAEGIVGVQLFGRDPGVMAEAAVLMESRGFPFIDINMGCPARKVVSQGEGSALLLEPKLCGEIVRAVSRAVGVPVTVKIRSGWDENGVNAPEVASILEQNGAAAIAVHARTREQQYSGAADRAVMRNVKRAVSIPVVANGDIRSAADARETLEQTGCDAIMIGRGACGNPWVFQSVLAGEDSPVSPETRAEGAIRHLRMLVEWMGEERGVIDARKHMSWYIANLRGASALRARLNALTSEVEVASLLIESFGTARLS